MPRSIAVVAALILFSFSSTAQLREEMTVSVVEVPVVVSRNGECVKGLTREDFELSVNGEPHPIDYFDVLEFRRGEPAPVAEPRPFTQRRLILLLFDFAGSEAGLVWQSRTAAEQFVASASPHDVFAVATLAPGGVRYLVPFTGDRVAVQRAIRTLRPSAAGDGFGIAMTTSERQLLGLEPSPGGATPQPADASAPTSATDIWDALNDRPAANVTSLEALDGGEQFADTLSTVADVMAPLEGLKQVLLLSQGKLGVREVRAIRLHKRFKDAGVVLNAVDVTGLSLAWPSRNLYMLALDTGGYVVGSTGVGRALDVFAERQSVTYVLGFRPRGPQMEHNEIRVYVRNQPPLVTDVQYRRGYSARSGAADDNSLFLADVMLNDIPQNGVSVDLGVDVKRSSARLRIVLPGRELLAGVSSGPVVLDSFAYVFAENGTVAGWHHKRTVVDVEKGRSVLEAGPYGLEEEFRLPPGRYVARVLVRLSDRIGFDRAAFTVAQD